MIRNFLELFEVFWCIQSFKLLVLAVMDTFKNPETMNMQGFRIILQRTSTVLVQSEEK